MTKQDDNTKQGYEISGMLKGTDTFKVEFADIRFTVRLLTIEDQKAAEQVSRLPGSTRKKPKYDEDRMAIEYARRAIQSWEHIDGQPLLNEGEVFKVTPENVELVLRSATGLGNFLLPKVCNAHKMYSTLDEDDIKN